MAKLIFPSGIAQSEFVDDVEQRFGEIGGMEIRYESIVLSRQEDFYEELKDLALEHGAAVEDWT